METTAENPRIVTPFLPSLSHLATVKIAIVLFHDFAGATFEDFYGTINYLDSSPYPPCNVGNEVHSAAAKACLLPYPPSLRKLVSEAVFGLYYAGRIWLEENYLLFLFVVKGPCVLHCRSDGTIDTGKTVQQFVMDASRNTISDRFYVACLFCLEESIVALWSEMENSVKNQQFGIGMGSMTRFWVRWLSDGFPYPWIRILWPRIPWPRAAAESLDPPNPKSYRYGPFFPQLKVEERRKFLLSLRHLKGDDLWLCLCSATKEEEKKVMPMNYDKTYKELLLRYLEWPLQPLFLETAEKMLIYDDDLTFCFFLKTILRLKDRRKDFDYSDLFEGFWHNSPAHLKEIARKCNFAKELDSCLNEIEKKKRSTEEYLTTFNIKK